MCAKSENLSFVPQAVDATNPPASVVSSAAAADSNSEFHSNTRIFRLYCLAFHHFPDDLARKILQSTLETSDGFAILELQDRRLGTLILMLGNFFVMFITTLWWFWKEPLHLFLTYIVPIVPFIMTWDGVVSSLRTREFEEVMALIENTSGDSLKPEIVSSLDDKGRLIKSTRIGNWTFEGGREMHTWPFGYFNWVVGICDASN